MSNKKEYVEIKSTNVDTSLLKSVLLHDHWNHAILRVCERLEIAIDDQKKSYSDKVEVLMSVLECLLTDCLIRVSPQITSLLFDFILKHTLFLILHNCWGESNIIKVHMKALFCRFKVRANKKKLKRVEAEIDYLLELISGDPWSCIALLKTLLEGNECDGELLKFFKSELGTFLNVRLEVLMYARCDKLAMILIEKCLDCIHFPTNKEYFKSFSNEISHLKYLYILILNNRNCDKLISRRIASEVNKMGLDQCLQFVNRCQNGVLPFKRLSKKSAIVVINTALASAVSKVDTDEIILQDVVQLWFETMTENRELLKRLLKHIVSLAVCSHYIYYLVVKVIEKVKLIEKELCVEVFVRGLTLNVNEIERFKSADDQTKAREHEIKLSNGFLLLAKYLSENEMLHREIVLAAFSLNPTQSLFTRIETLGEKKDEIVVEMMDIGNEQCLNKNGETTLLCSVTCESTVVNEEKLDICSDSAQPQKDQTFIKNEVNETKSSEKPRCILSQIVANLCLEDEDCLVDGHDKENYPKNVNNKTVSKGSHYLRLFDEKTIGIGQALCDDLASLVCYAKNQDLSWDIEWPEVIRRCSHILHQESNESTNKIGLNALKAELNNFSQGENESTCSNGFHSKVKNPIKSSKRKRKHFGCTC